MVKHTHKDREAGLAARTPEVSAEDASELQAIGQGIQSLGRRTTEQGFELGDYLARAKAILAERALGAWVKAICKFTPKTARNYIAIHENLAAYKERLVATGTSPTTLFVLAYADREKVEDVLAALEAGEELTVSQVKTMVGATPPKKTADDAVLYRGGMAGLRGIAQLKVEQDAVKFLQLVTGILARVEKALEPLARKRAVLKGSLQEGVMNDCRHAHDLINSIAAPLQPSMVASVNWRPAKLPEGTTWRKVQTLLGKMGGSDWPGKDDFVSWLQTEVIPLLRFVVHGDPVEEEGLAEERVAPADPVEQADDKGLLTYDAMPPQVQATMDAALDIVPSAKRNEIRAQIVYDTRPMKRGLRRVAA